MTKKKVLVWETLSTVAGGQQMTLTVMDMLRDQFDFLCLIPTEGMLSEELKKRGIPYRLMGDQALPSGVKGKSVIFRYGWMSVKSIVRSLMQIIRFKPDILYAPGPASLPWSAICGTLTKKPVIWHLHHNFQDGPTKKLLNLCGKWRAVRRILAVSNSVGSQITGTDKTEVLYNPVDHEKYAQGNGSALRAEAEKLLGRSLDGALVIGQIGLIQPTKRQDFVCGLVSRLREMGHDAIGLFAGACREPAYLQELQAADAPALFLGHRDDVPDLLRVLDLLVLPSVEGFPLAGLEAAAAGVPVAACDVAGAAEFIRVSGNGLTFKENDLDSATAAVLQILKHKEAMTQQGQAFAKKMATGAYAEQIRQLFCSVL